MFASSQRIRGFPKVSATPRKGQRRPERGGKTREPNHLEEAATIQLVLQPGIRLLAGDDVATGAALLHGDGEEAEERRDDTRASPCAFRGGKQYHRDGDTRTSWDRDLAVELFTKYVHPPR